jgi:hypothetical protein
MLGMKLTAVLSLFCALACADDTPKPACNAKTLGQFWPSEANADRDANRRLAQQGDLQICSYGKWKYGWKALSVSVQELSRQPGRAPDKSGPDTRPGN